MRSGKMNRKQFALYGMMITAAMGATIGWSISIGNAVLPVATVILGMVLLYLGKTRVTEVLEDERIHRISEKASRRTLQIFGISIAIIGVVLVALKEFTEIGFTLAYSTIALLFLYSIFYRYYSIKTLD
jgi:uncharacterized membrane protein